MEYQVSVILKDGAQHNIRLSESDAAVFDSSSAYEWIGDAFYEADLEAPSPAGKILMKDQILMLALEQKPAAWAEPTPELKKFLAAVVKALGRASVTIDLVNNRL